MDKLLEFIKNQKLITIASHNKDDIWVANVYFDSDEKGKIYFITSEDTKHAKMITENPKVAFSIAWFDSENAKNRKGVQGLGICKIGNLKETAIGISLLYKKFPDLHDILTIDWITKNVWKTRVWVIEPSFIKYFDDEIYGDDESEEFNF